MDEMQFKCTKCSELKPRLDYSTNYGARRAQCKLCHRKAWHERYSKPKGGELESLGTSVFRGSPHVDSPNMRLRYHLVDPVQGELIATAATVDAAREAAIKYHYKHSVRIKFVEIYDEETQKVYHLTRPTKRYAEGVMRGPCKPVSEPDGQLRVLAAPRGPGKKFLKQRQSEGRDETGIDILHDSVPHGAPGVR